MAYINQETKKELMPQIKAVLKEYDVKASVRIRNSSVLIVALKQGSIDFNESYESTSHAIMKVERDLHEGIQIHTSKNFTGKAEKFIEALTSAMNKGNHDNSDVMTDYFDVGWYSYIEIGGFNKPYQVIKGEQ